MPVFNLHFGVPADVNDLFDAALRVHLGFDCDVHIEGLVGLFLAVLNTKLFACVLCNEGFRVNAVKMALAE